RATAWRQIKPFDLDQTQVAIARGLFTQRQLRRFTRRHVPNRDRAILPDYVVRELNRALDYPSRRIIQLDVDLARRLEHAKAARGSVEKRDERLRKNVLARVLLHVVQPSRPVDAPSYHITARRRRTLDHVQHAVITVVDTLDNTHTIERARVARLTTASRIKRSAIENERGPAANAIGDVDDACLKLDQMGIGIIETFGY